MPRERVLAALSRQVPDRVPRHIDFNTQFRLHFRSLDPAERFGLEVRRVESGSTREQEGFERYLESLPQHLRVGDRKTLANYWEWGYDPVATATRHESGEYDLLQLHDYNPLAEARTIQDLQRYRFPAVASDIEEMFSALAAFVEEVESPYLKALLRAFFADEAITALFKKAPAAKGFHHVAVGGLLEHTLSVTRLLSTVVSHYQGINRDLLIAGGILHDIGKIHEFSFDRLIDYSDEGRLIGHIVISLEMVDQKIAAIENFPERLAMELRHLILSHHGMLEFGSPKRPKTLEALIVHYIDDLDAKVNAFQEFIKGSPDEESDWTPFHRLFDRFIYKGKDAGNTQ